MTAEDTEHYCEDTDRSAKAAPALTKMRWKCAKGWKHRPWWHKVVLICLLVPGFAALMLASQGLVCYVEWKNPLAAIGVIVAFSLLGISVLLSVIAMAVFRSRYGLLLFLASLAIAIGLRIRFASFF